MKIRILGLKISKILLLLLSSAVLLVLSIKGFNTFSMRQSNENQNNAVLNYIIFNPRSPVTLDLYEAEAYEPAIIVQSLVGNLVYYSNQGRYEPRLAKSWNRIDSKTWEFELNSGLKCENGETIDANSFRQSLLRTIKFLGQTDEIPVLNMLQGYKSFVAGKGDLVGIEAKDLKITFKFVQPLRNGLVQILSFAPFGYISKENLKEDGAWKDKEKFISSGPYRLKNIEIGKQYVLEQRSDWTIPFSDSAPRVIKFTHTLPENLGKNDLVIFDGFQSDVVAPEQLEKYPLVPEYINPILLGNLDKGYFSKKEHRDFLRFHIEKQRAKLPDRWGPHTRSDAFYPNQTIQNKMSGIIESKEQELPIRPLVIEGAVPGEGTPRAYAWKVLSAALDDAKIAYRFANNDAKTAEVLDQSYDIRIRGSSIGGGVEPWGLRILFCSPLGPGFPDPSGRICKALDEYDADLITDDELGKSFLAYVDEDSAVIPVSHYGVQLYLSPSIKRESLSPALSIIRFDKLETYL